jgi:hypothetical protein
MSGSPSITDVSSALLYKTSNNKKRFDLRVIEYKDKDGVLQRKFGLSEFWCCPNTLRWLPSAKHHVFIPINLWPDLVALGRIVEPYIGTGDGGHSGAIAASSQSAVAREPHSASSRQYGRYNEHDNERNALASIPTGTGEGNDTSSFEAAPEPKKRREQDCNTTGDGVCGTGNTVYRERTNPNNSVCHE